MDWYKHYDLYLEVQYLNEHNNSLHAQRWFWSLTSLYHGSTDLNLTVILLSLEYQNFFYLCLCSPIKGFYICICPVIQRALSNFQTGATKILPASQTHKKQNLYFFFSELFSSKVMEQELKLVFDMNFQKLIITQLLVEHVFFNHIKVMQFF